MLSFDQTGHWSTRTPCGAATLARVTQDDADRALETVREYGVNHRDIAASYGDADLRLGPWMARGREEYF